MKQIISDMAQGHDQSELFPSVVKCVVSKSLEVC
jgi:vesicle coat complex subunit